MNGNQVRLGGPSPHTWYATLEPSRVRVYCVGGVRTAAQTRCPGRCKRDETGGWGRQRRRSPVLACLLGEALDALERDGLAVVGGAGARPRAEHLVDLAAALGSLEVGDLVVAGGQDGVELAARVD